MTTSQNNIAIPANSPALPLIDEQELIETLLQNVKGRIADIDEQENAGKKIIGSSKYKDREFLKRIESILSLVQAEEFRKAIAKDEKELLSGVIKESVIEKNPLLKSFCLWLSCTENGHYHISYFYPNLKDFFKFISSFCQRLKQIVVFISLVETAQWELLKNKKADFLIDDFFIVEASSNKGWRVDIDIYKIKNLLKIANNHFLLGFHKPGYKSPSLKILTQDLTAASSNKDAKKKLEDKIDFIISSVKFGTTTHD